MQKRSLLEKSVLKKIYKSVYGIANELTRFFFLHSFVLPSVQGSPIYNVETVSYLFNEHSSSGVDASKSSVVSPVGVGKHFVTAIRY